MDAVSLMAVDLDSNKEAHYLQQLAKGLRIQPELANNICLRRDSPHKEGGRTSL